MSRYNNDKKYSIDKDNKPLHNNSNYFKREDNSYYNKRYRSEELSPNRSHDTNKDINFRQFIKENAIYKKKGDWGYYYMESTKQIILEYKFWKFFENTIDEKLEQDKRKIEEENNKKELEKKKEIAQIIDTSVSKFSNTISNMENMQVQIVAIMDKLSNTITDKNKTKTNKPIEIRSQHSDNNYINVKI